MPPRIEPFYAEVGRRLHDLRQAAGLTQEQLGARLSPPMTRTSIANIETGKQRVLVKTLVDIADTLEVPVTDLLPQTAAPKASHPKKDPSGIREELATKLDLSSEMLEQVISKIDATSRS
ncbi:helix-turn-helix transcriptional regulator [Sorangium sp. So ce315]|uniref:helix-turn-helix domain-containing protein n=1 Tax=Sorangium sp. So ce315 TaxID=3133299 RepID=UPI003F6361F3